MKMISIFLLMILINFIPIYAVEETTNEIIKESEPELGSNEPKQIVESEQKTNVSNIFNYLNLFVAVFTGVAVPLFLYFLGNKRTEHNTLVTSSRSLLREVEHNEMALSGEMNYAIINSNSDEEHSQIKYTNAYLDFDSYDSLIASGQFIHFDVETQGLLRELYNRVKDHYRNIVYSSHLEDKAAINKVNNLNFAPEVLIKYDNFLTKTEKEILERTSDVKESLNKVISKSWIRWS